MNFISIRGIDSTLPSCWDELTPQQLIWLAKRFPLTPTRGFVYDFFIYCLNLPRRPRAAWAFALNVFAEKRVNRFVGNAIRIAAEKNLPLNDTLPEVDFFKQQLAMAIDQLENFEWLFTDFVLNKNLLPVINFRFKKYYGPDWLLSNLTADEFDHADQFFLSFLQDKDEADLNRLIATLWRRKTVKAEYEDIRQPFSEFLIEENAASIAKWPMHQKTACLLIYSGMRNAFVALEDSKAVFSSSGSGKSTDNAWAKILLSLAHEGSLGTYQTVKKTYIHDIVLKLAQIKKQPAPHVPR